MESYAKAFNEKPLSLASTLVRLKAAFFYDLNWVLKYSVSSLNLLGSKPIIHRHYY